MMFPSLETSSFKNFASPSQTVLDTPFVQPSSPHLEELSYDSPATTPLQNLNATHTNPSCSSQSSIKFSHDPLPLESDASTASPIPHLNRP